MRKFDMRHTHKRLAVALISVGFLLALGTVFYHHFQQWSWLDSIYFTSMTLTTIGYGDHVPTLPITKIFTIFLAFTGVGMVFYTITLVATEYLDHRVQSGSLLPSVPKLPELTQSKRKTKR